MVSQTVNILLIEDEEGHAELISHNLHKQADSYNLTIVNNLTQAREQLRNSLPDLIITDMSLPDGKGIDLLKSKEEPKDYPMIVITSHGNEELAVQAIKQGALDYIVKSDVTFMDMPRIVERTLREWHHIVKRRQAEEQIQESLREKETLLQEIHHRVKNNMAVIASLLKLQMQRIDDKQVRDALKDSQTRVYSMAAVHETLYSSGNLTDILVETFIGKIAKFVFQSYQTNSNQINLKTEIDSIRLSIEKAPPLGLAVNELVSNALKYAFVDDREGEIRIRIKRLHEENVEVIVEDNGIGMPKDLDWDNPEGLGLQLVKKLVENQLDGTLDVISEQGTRFVIRLKI